MQSAEERGGYVETLMDFNRKVGELETKPWKLEGPGRERGIPRRLSVQEDKDEHHINA